MHRFIIAFLFVIGVPGLVSDFDTWLGWLGVNWPPGIGTALVIIAVAWAVFSYGREQTRSTSAAELTIYQLFELEKLDRERKLDRQRFLQSEWPGLIVSGVFVAVVFSLIYVGVTKGFGTTP